MRESPEKIHAPYTKPRHDSRENRTKYVQKCRIIGGSLKSFLVEAVLFGVISFVAGLLLFAFAAQPYSTLVSKAFGIDAGALQIGIFAPGGMTLVLASLAMALSYSLMAQALPIYAAIRRNILTALRG